MSAPKKKPNPGSDEAVASGCKCAVIDNDHGRGAYLVKGEPVFWIAETCQMHCGKEEEVSVPKKATRVYRVTVKAFAEAWTLYYDEWCKPGGTTKAWQASLLSRGEAITKADLLARRRSKKAKR